MAPCASRLLVCLVASAVLFPAAGADRKIGAPGTNVEMPFLIAPMSKDGKLLGYAYISSKLVASSSSAAIDVRKDLAFIQDAYVRDVNAQPVSKADDPQQVDTDLLSARLTADAKRIVGDNKVVTVVFTLVQFAPLHPSDSTLNSAPPNQAATPAAGAPTAGAAPSPPVSAATSKPTKDSTH
jgi:hypothetical protein